MKNEIRQNFEKINCKNVMERKSYPAWFFGNERTNKILLTFIGCLKKEEKVKKIFCIGGGGDFTFSILSIIEKISEVYTCDNRPTAALNIDIKKSIVDKFSYEEIIDIFSRKKINKIETYNKIVDGISIESKTVLNNILDKCNGNNFLHCIRKSGLWYKYSFGQIKHINDYLLYLTDKEKYLCLKQNLEKLAICYGDFNDNLKLFNDKYFDLIYVSNIFDSKNYCNDVDGYIRTIKNKLTSNGYLFIVTQNNPEILINIFKEKFGFVIYLKETHKFKMFESLFGHYSYSFVIVRINNNLN